MWAAHFLPHEQPMKWLTSGGSGTMGFCVPAAMGAKVAQPDKVPGRWTVSLSVPLPRKATS